MNYGQFQDLWLSCQVVKSLPATQEITGLNPLRSNWKFINSIYIVAGFYERLRAIIKFETKTKLVNGVKLPCPAPRGNVLQYKLYLGIKLKTSAFLQYF